MTPNQLIDALKRLPPEVMDRPIMDDDDTITPGWSLVPADICIGTGEFLTNGDVGIIPDPDKDPDEDLKAEAGEWEMPLQRELRATLHSYMRVATAMTRCGGLTCTSRTTWSTPRPTCMRRSSI